MTYIYLLGALVVVLFGSELFTNGVEWFGWHLDLGDGAVGSVLAAVGTALPETIVPILAIVLGATADSQEIGIGAIIGSSFMLSTLALFVTGLAIFVFSKRGGRQPLVQVDKTVMRRDLSFFITAYTATILAAVFGRREIQLAVALILIGAYLVYVFRTVSQDQSTSHSLRQLYVAPRADPPHIALVSFQIIISLAIIIVGARFFVSSIETIASGLVVPALILSLFVTPFATELPEQLNSVLWVRQGKDTLALGNITGAMVFQACILPAIGVVLTPWQLTPPALVATGLALLAAGSMYILVRTQSVLHYWYLMAVGLIYFGYLASALFIFA